VDTENLVGIVYKGGEGSGHHDHQGRPGEVGGSLPSGAAGAATDEAKISIPRTYKSAEFGARLDKQIDAVEKILGRLPNDVILITDDVDAAIKAVLESEQEGMESRYGEETYKIKYDKLRRRIEHRLSGGNIHAYSDEVVVYVSEELTVGEFTYTPYGKGERTIVAAEDEPEYVMAHELAHSFYDESRRAANAVQEAHWDFLEKNYPERWEKEHPIPSSYQDHMRTFVSDISVMTKEFYADMLGYGFRLEQNPEETRIMIGGKRGMTVGDWKETDENPQDLARVLVEAARNYYSEYEEGEDAGE